VAPDSLIIRRAGEADLEPWSRLWEESARAAFTPLLPDGHRFPEAQPERLRARLGDPALAILVAQAGPDAELAGFTACGPSRDLDAGPDVGELRTFFVAAGRWRQGVGSRLMAAALEFLRERPYAAATVWSFAANERANAFYERNGFALDGGERTEEAWAHILEMRYRRALP
jgi:GNAT superfamily N-acetyltransferase